MSLIFKHTVTLLVDLEMLLLSLHALHDNDILIILKSLSILFGIKFLSLRKQPTSGDATTGFPAKWRLRNEHRNSILMTCPYPDLGSASDWLNQNSNAVWSIRSTTQILVSFAAVIRVVTRVAWRVTTLITAAKETKIWVVMRHPYGISALVSQKSFCGNAVVASLNVSCFLRLKVP